MPQLRERPARTAIRILGIGVLVAAVTLIDLRLLPRIDAAFFYFLPIVAACIWFHDWGLLLIPVSLGIYHWNLRLDLPAEQPYPVGQDLVKLLSFSLIAGLTLLAQRRYLMLQGAEHQQEALRRAAEVRGTRLESLYRVASAANASRGAEEFLSLFVEEIRRLVPGTCIATVLEREGDVLVRRAAAGPDATGAVGERVPLGKGIAGRVALSGQPLALHGTQFPLADVASDWVRAAGPASAMAVPLTVKGETTGVVVLFGQAGAHFSRDDLRLLESMAAEAALVLESLRLYESLRSSNAALRERQQALDEQLALAREVQAAILSVCPDHCVVGPLEIASCHESAWEVGGDILRVVPHEEGAAVFVGDVMGKGVPAALLMTMMTAELSSPNAPASDPRAVLAEANRVLIDNIATLEATGFITACYVHIAADGRRLSYASAGHPPGILVHPGGTSELLMAQGLPLGIFRETAYTATERPLQPGDRLVLYTDGVTEARDAAGAFYGTERLHDVVLAHHALPAAGLRDAIVRDVQAFLEGRPPADDIALIVVGVSE